MKEIKIIVYSFDELSEDAKQKAIQANRDINFDFKWWDHTYDDAKSIGLKIESFDLDRNKHATGAFILGPLEVAQNIINEHGEHTETSKTAKHFLSSHVELFVNYLNPESEFYESKETENDLIYLEEEFLSNILKDYANILQREYEYLSSDEAIIETIEANEYNFLKRGKMFNV
jgi:hypothetical protein